MAKKRFSESMTAGDEFVVTAEFVPLPGHRLANFERFLTGYAEKKDRIPAGITLSGVTIPQSPGGVASMSPLDIYSLLERKGLWDDLDVIPHVTAKDHNCDAIETSLVGIRKLGLDSVLLLTGDKPAAAQGVFEIESIGLIEMVKEMNNAAFDKVRAGEFDSVHQFYIAAAVSQFKYTEASQMQQYYKMAKKVRVGADCLMTQVGWDWRKSEELLRYMKENKIDVPVLGNVYFLTTMTPAPRLMNEGKLPGCVVTDELFDKLKSETPERHIERAAQQVAMYRDLGVAGVDLGGIFDFDMLIDILEKAEEIGNNWRDHSDNLSFAPEGGWYLYDDAGKQRELSKPRAKLSKRNFGVFHNMLFEPGKGVRGPVKAVLGLSKGIRKGEGALETAFHSIFEKPMKSLLFHCEECGDCYLHENFSLCTIGRCEKGLSNAPCGDANPDGTCGNNENIQCVGELIYEAAASEGAQGLTTLATRINPPRIPALAGTSSILNNFFDRDHCRDLGLVQIGDNIHSLIPKVAAALKEITAQPDGFDKPSGALAFIISLISGQAKHNADYISLNVDAFVPDDAPVGTDAAAPAAELARHLARLVRKHGQGVPVCFDSAHITVLKAGLDEWRKTASADIAEPMLRLPSPADLDEAIAFRAENAFKLMVRLDRADTPDQLHQQADSIVSTATAAGFATSDLFIEMPVTPLMNDVPGESEGPSRTHATFQAIKKIKANTVMKNLHLAVGVADSRKKVPGRSVGICRAFVAAALPHGLDTIIVDTTKDYGITPAAGDLVKLVNTFAQQDGSAPARENTQQAIDAFCKANQKARIK